MFKAFFLFIAGIIVFALLMALLGVMIGGVSVFPLKNFFLEGFWQNFLAWTTLLLFLGAPVIAFFTWVIRRIIGVKSKNKYLGYTFAGLWVIGLISGIILAAFIANDFSTVAREKSDFTVAQPANGKMIVKVAESNFKVYGRWMKMDGLLSMTDDSIYLNNVRVRIVKSPDSNYHAFAVKSSHAADHQAALSYARGIAYNVNQQDSLLYLDRGFGVPKGTRFRNQSVTITIQVPVGKRILMDRSVNRKLDWIHIGRRSDDWDGEDWDSYQDWHEDVEYIMTVGGLERVDKDTEEKSEEDVMEDFKKSKEELRRQIEEEQRRLEEKKRELEKSDDSTRYRFKPSSVETEQPAEQEAETDHTTASIKQEEGFTPRTALLRFID
jgi:hypothetical protein